MAIDHDLLISQAVSGVCPFCYRTVADLRGHACRNFSVRPPPRERIRWGWVVAGLLCGLGLAWAWWWGR